PSAIADWPSGAPLTQAVTIDHCFTGWTGSARCTLREGVAIALTASADLSWLHVYSPADQAIFCLEPSSHRPAALNAADPVGLGVRILAPGETMRAWAAIDLLH